MKQHAPLPVLPDDWTNVENMGKINDLSNPMHFSNSNFRRVSNEKMLDDNIDDLHGISKRLFQSPHTTPTTITQGKRGSSSAKGKKPIHGSTSSVTKRCRSVLPKGIKWNFPVTSDMKLDLPELQAIAYVYHPDKDKSKRLVVSRGIEAFRVDFDTLRPGHMVNEKIVTLACHRANWVQENYKRGFVWYLPPAFAIDVFMGKTVEQQIDVYCKDWIYVPIKTSTDHWFLMVISMQLHTIYHLDSHCGIGDVKPRRVTISVIARTLEEMVTSGFYGTTFYCRALEFKEWPIEEAHGIPNCGHSNNAAVWVIDWIDMDQCFTPNLQGELKENFVRVKTSAILVLGLYNDMWTFIEEEAKNFWALIAS
ncbi:ubiquitin-specific protease ESD4 [Trifolium repens]|nr:ubiquitin-specific protease ESD4 [Trifolium repens]